MTWLLLALVACTKDAADDSAPPLIDDSAPDCSGHDPVLNAVTIGNGGIQTFETEQWPTVNVSFEAEDEDGNLNAVFLEIWYDEVLDGEVETSGSPQIEKSVTLTDTDCEVTATGGATSVGLNIQVGSALEYNTEYDWAGRITDAADEISNVAFATGSTPMADGSDGDGTGPQDTGR